jgi:hypothetical protein
VRETFAPRDDVDPAKQLEKARHYAMYKASGGDPRDNMNWHYYGERWIPSIYMPRWASRITLINRRVWVERVQEIGEEDAIAEGIERVAPGSFGFRDYEGDVGATFEPWKSFCTLWDSINAAKGYGWDMNPWVWCVEFDPERSSAVSDRRERL